jgi:hypothetical protein
MRMRSDENLVNPYSSGQTIRFGHELRFASDDDRNVVVQRSRGQVARFDSNNADTSARHVSYGVTTMLGEWI